MRTFSSTVRCGNTAEIWNERTSPIRAIAAGREPVISRPLKKIWPRVGVRKCVSRLKQVVFPAPFGPISAWIVPRVTARLDVVDGDEALELLRKPARFEDRVVGHGTLEKSAHRAPIVSFGQARIIRMGVPIGNANRRAVARSVRSLVPPARQRYRLERQFAGRFSRNASMPSPRQGQRDCASSSRTSPHTRRRACSRPARRTRACRARSPRRSARRSGR